MNKNLNILVLVAALAIGGCNRGPAAAPTGQVVATVDGREITMEELHAETGDLAATLDPDTRRAVEQNALQQIISRAIVANYAVAQKLDKTPLAAILKNRSEQEALVNLVQRKLTGDVPAPSAEEVQLFIRDHPSSFAQRHIFVVDQLTSADVPPAVQQQLDTATTLPQAQQVLSAAGIKFVQTVGTIDALSIDPNAAEKLASLPAGTVFISPEGNVLRVNHIREVVTSPIEGADAVRVAREAIQSQRAEALTQRQMAAIVTSGQSKVRYNANYKPAKPAQAAAQGSGQAAAQ